MKHRRPLTPLISGISLVVMLWMSTAWLAFNQNSDRKPVRYLVTHSRRALAYKITDNRSALFKLGPHDTDLELISNLDISTSPENAREDAPHFSDPGDNEYPYTLEVTVLDRNLQPISNQLYWEKTRRTTWLDEKTGNPMEAAYYLYNDVCAADSRITTVHVHGTVGHERYVAVRLTSPRPGSAAIRLYKHVNLQSERDIKGLRHLPKKMRTKLARHNLFGSDLTQLELSRAMMDVLSQIPAETRQGFEYSTRQLFLYDHCTPLQGDRPPRHSISNSIEQPAFFPVTGPAELTLRLNNTHPVRATVWQGDTLLSETVRTPSRKRTLTFDFGSGTHVLKVQSTESQTKIVDTVLDPPTAWTGEAPDIADIFPVHESAYYRILPETDGIPIDVALPRDIDSSQRLIKLICRASDLDSNETPSDTFSVTFRYLDSSGNLLDSGSFQGQVTPSDIARYSGTPLEILRPGAPQRFYFCPPENARMMSLTSDRPVDVACFNRLNPMDQSSRTSGIAGQSRDAHASIRFQSELADQKEYYYFRPRNAETLAVENRKRWVSLPRGVFEPVSPTANHESLSDAQSVYPLGSLKHALVYEPADRRDTPSGTYVYFDANQPVEIQIGNSAGRARLGIRYSFRETADPFLSIRVDGQCVAQFRPVTCRGYFEIPGISPGQHTIQVQSHSASTQLFMKLPRGVTADGNQYALRKVYVLHPGDTLTVPMDLRTEAAHGLNILAYAPEHRESPIRLKAFTEAGCPPTDRALKCLTIPLRRFEGEIEATNGPHPIHVGSMDQLLGPERFFFPLHDDLAREPHMITIESGSDYPVYLRFFTMLPGTEQGA